MKAYMSDAEARYVRRMGAKEVYLPADAEQEARRILAETEPRVPCRDVFGVGRTSATEHSNIGPLAMCHEPYKALAESLAAFVAK